MQCVRRIVSGAFLANAVRSHPIRQESEPHAAAHDRNCRPNERKFSMSLSTTAARVQTLQQECNDSNAFKRASEWADTKVLLVIGTEKFWLKLYRGQIIDVMEFLPMTNALGYDVLVSGDDAAWARVDNGAKSWDVISTGQVAIEGNLIEANRLHEAICIMIETWETTSEVRNAA